MLTVIINRGITDQSSRLRRQYDCSERKRQRDGGGGGGKRERDPIKSVESAAVQGPAGRIIKIVTLLFLFCFSVFIERSRAGVTVGRVYDCAVVHITESANKTCPARVPEETQSQSSATLPLGPLARRISAIVIRAQTQFSKSLLSLSLANKINACYPLKAPR